MYDTCGDREARAVTRWYVVFKRDLNAAEGISSKHVHARLTFFPTLHLPFPSFYDLVALIVSNCATQSQIIRGYIPLGV